MFGRFRSLDENSDMEVDFEGDVFDGIVYPAPEYQHLDDEYALSSLLILSPVLPSKIICVGLNYSDHARELNMPVPKNPILFLKPPTALLPHNGCIVYPGASKQVEYEAELAVIIGKDGKNISSEDSDSYIAGFSCFNDVTARDLQKEDGQWTRAKSFDTFAPLGPFIVTPEELEQQNLNPENLNIQTRITDRDGNIRVCQNSNTAELIFKIPKLIAFISNIMTLKKGDVIATGTPPGVGQLLPGETVDVEIEGIGILSNTVIEDF
ncbi:fumarylacetoacetate hydrolase family protein [Methanolapillus millepedarum]|uniref:Fumarylacetoacetase-like C-terminal domain-containing protein n=1 Tax=Methanolapillus millepedarum TaxID=3028296 RepID=A0AA96V3L9_9EURY|nr:putative protein YisK [Methanosarcinaceae archaeon Ac7]